MTTPAFKEQYKVEMEKVLEQFREFEIEHLQVKGYSDSGEFNEPITYFDVNGTGKLEDMIENLYETMYLNPPHEMWLIVPGSAFQVY